MRRYLIALALLSPVAAQAACPTPPSSCPSPTFNSITLAVPAGVGSGGTGLASGTSGGIPGFTGSTTLTSSVALTSNALVLGGGAGATPTPMASLGTTTTLLHGNASGAPTFGAVGLTVDVSGILPVSNGGTGLASGTSGGILGYTAAGTLASSGVLANHGLLVGAGAGATPTAITAGTNGQIPVSVTAGNPVMQTLSGDVSAVTSGGAVTVSKIGGVSLSLSGATSLGTASSTVGAGTYYAGHSLIGIQTFCASGCTATGGTYTPDAGTNQVIIETQAAGGASGGCAATSAVQNCLSAPGTGGSYAQVLYTSGFSGVTITPGASGAGGVAGNNPGSAGTAATVGALISCPAGLPGSGGGVIAAASFAFIAVPSIMTGCTIAGGTTLLNRAGGSANAGIALGAEGVISSGMGGNSMLGSGGQPVINGNGVNAGQLYGGGASGVGALNSAAAAGAAGGGAIIIIREFN